MACSQMNFRTERSPPDCSWPGSFRPVFLVNISLTRTPPLAQGHSGSPARRPSRRGRDQKTFSAGPRSLNTKELWFPGREPVAVGVQPCFDSRHGRITSKVFLGRVILTITKVESSRLQSTQRTRGSDPAQTLCWLTATLQNRVCSNLFS